MSRYGDVLDPEGDDMYDEPPAWAAWAEADAADARKVRQLGDGPGSGQIGKVRNTGLAIVLFVLTLGLYSIYWSAVTHSEMRRHSGLGLGGGLAGVLTFLFWPVMPFLTSGEVGALYDAAGQRRAVSGLTGLWAVPGFLLLILPVVWFVQTNEALNDYWRGLGAGVR